MSESIGTFVPYERLDAAVDRVLVELTEIHGRQCPFERCRERFHVYADLVLHRIDAHNEHGVVVYACVKCNQRASDDQADMRRHCAVCKAEGWYEVTLQRDDAVAAHGDAVTTLEMSTLRQRAAVLYTCQRCPTYCTESVESLTRHMASCTPPPTLAGSCVVQ